MDVAEKLGQLENLYRENRLSHVYLLETNDLQKATTDVIKLIKKINCEFTYKDTCQKCNVCNLINNNSLPSLIVIEPDGQNIKKEQVIDLKKRFSFKPIYTPNNVYIIKNADKLNGSSANTMLKFIEEPGDNIIGFLITTNLNNVISTIRSRCEILSLMYTESTEEIAENIKKVASNYLQLIELEKVDKIMYNKNVLNDYSERSDIEQIFHEILNLYIEAYEGKTTLAFLSNLAPLALRKRISLTAKFLEDLNNNANIELLMDKFIIELSDDDAENI